MLYYILSRLGSICPGLACYSISYHALAVSAQAWHATLYLITPPLNFFSPTAVQRVFTVLQPPQTFLQTPCKFLRNPIPYTPKSLDPNLQTLNPKSSSGQEKLLFAGEKKINHYHRYLAVSAQAWHAIAAILYSITLWQYLPRLGMLFFILRRLGSICPGLSCCSIS